MGLFSKRRSEVVDLSDMQRRGLLPTSPPPEADERGIVDFSKSSQTIPQSSSTPTINMDFLSSLAGAGVNSSSANSGSVTDSLRDARKRNHESAEINELRLKLEDNEYKMRNMSDKIRELEEKINALIR